MFKEWIITITVKDGFYKCISYHCLIYRLYTLSTVIIKFYIDYALEIRDEPYLLYIIMYQEIMGDSINVPTAVILGMNDQMLPHKEEPKGLWTGTDLKMS